MAGTAVGGDSLTVNFGCVGSEPFHGVAPRATLIGIKVLNANGSGSFSDVIAGINYGADQSASGGRCDVINMSLGGGAFSGTCDGDSAAAAANAAVDAGVVVVSSSGNDANTNAMGTPACASKVIAVGATYDDSFPNCEFPSQTSFTFCTCSFITCCGTCTDNAPSVDQIGCYSNRSTELDVVAPGCITFSTDIDNSLNGIVGFCGTSMASPHVAGLAALLLSADSSLTPAQVRQAIRDGAIDLGSPGFDSVYGHGRIDAINSLALIGPGCSVPGDCDDLNPCTVDDCVGGSCSNTPINCDDGNACTSDSCSGGACVNDPISCDDSDPCTSDGCDAGTGCVNTPIDCDDSDACTSDSCSGGVCVNDTINCDDGDACTNDSCDAGTGCVNDPVQCLPDEVCLNGVCEPLVCDNDGICESGENCNNCSNDCFSGSGGFCGDGICAGSANGEDCFSCDLDCRCAGPGCNACCGDGFCGNNGEKASNCPVDCDPGFVAPSGGSCCGDGICEGSEDEVNCAVACAVTCSVPADCDDGVGCTDDDCIGGMCVSTANDANCPDDGLFCNGSEFCDAASDCSSDGDPCPGGTTCNEATDACDPDPCLPSGSSCSVDEDCCSNKCKNGTCRGN